MKIGIMQPYFFPYLGYWQHMNAVDEYVVYDDVNYINRGRINRNAILANGEIQNINLPLLGASQNKLINEIAVNTDPDLQKKLLRSIEHAYCKAPYYSSVLPMIRDIVTQTESNLAKYLMYSFQVIGDYLGITTNLRMSSELPKNCELRSYEKIIDICKILGGTEYYNSISGVPLYEQHRPEFEREGLELSFLKMKPIAYSQFKKEFVPNLSIIDLMMFQTQTECKQYLQEYELIKGEL